MSNRVTITLHIDIPEGLVPDVQYSSVEPEMWEGDPAPEPVQEFRPMKVLDPPSAPLCSTHKVAMARWPAGTNKAGKPYNASWRCPIKDCPTKPLWDRDVAPAS